MHQQPRAQGLLTPITHASWHSPVKQARLLENTLFGNIDFTGVQRLLQDRRVIRDIVDGMQREIRGVQNDPNAVSFYSFVQPRVTVY